MTKLKVTEVIFWQNGNVMAFQENGRQVPECQIGCILSEEMIKKHSAGTQKQGSPYR